MTEPTPITGWVIVNPDGQIEGWTFHHNQIECIHTFTHGAFRGPLWHPLDHHQRQGYSCRPAKLEVTA